MRLKTNFAVCIAMRTNSNNIGHAPQDVTQLPKSAGTSNRRLAARKHASSVLVATGDEDCVILTCVRLQGKRKHYGRLIQLCLLVNYG